MEQQLAAPAPQAMSFNSPINGSVQTPIATRAYSMSPQMAGGIQFVGAQDARAGASGAPQAIDITKQVMEDSQKPKQSQFRKATDAGFAWNDAALADYGFSPEEIAHLKSRGLEQGSLDYFMEQGWLSPAVAPQPEAPVAPPEYVAPQEKPVAQPAAVPVSPIYQAPASEADATLINPPPPQRYAPDNLLTRIFGLGNSNMSLPFGIGK